ncbi:S-layer homology domain-containing protein [Paenibacillus andongensis]|uniref:S-layer homology domain-containing protein n=1 Tax=Paenibacillus andongensis TaxID=2975482 RepID=UPI0021BB7D3A|nr:fibronectin type III domain-containing protein [Paenibacillus andongensis]
MRSLFQQKWSLLMAVVLILQSIVPVWAYGAQNSSNSPNEPAQQRQEQEILPAWAVKEISTLRDKNVIQGYEDGKFYPERLISRAEFSAVLNRAFGEYAADDAQGEVAAFKDVSSGWAAEEVKKAVLRGWAQGFPDGTFRPEQSVSRQDAAVMLNRILKLNPAKELNFEDRNSIPKWATADIAAVSEASVLEGYPDGTFQGGKLLTRAEAAVILFRVLEYLRKHGESHEARSVEIRALSVTGAPLADADVFVREKGKLSVLQKGKSGSDGKIVFRLPNGMYDVTLQKEGLAAYQAVKFGKENSQISIQAEKAAIITGNLLLKAGTPAAGASVTLTTNPTFLVVTGSDGRFQVGVLPERNYRMNVGEEDDFQNGKHEHEPLRVLKAPKAGETLDIGTVNLSDPKPPGGGGGSDDRTPPAVPAGLQANAGIGSAALQWSAVSDADLSGYNVYMSADGGKTWNPALKAGNVTQYTVTGLTAGVTYTFAVTAVDTSGNESAKSATVQATPLPAPDRTPPAVPAGLQTAAGIESAALQWTAVSDADLSGYNVYVSTDGGTTWNPALNAGNVTQYTVTGLTAGVSYTFAVTAVDTSGNESAKSATVQATPLPAPDRTPPSVPAGLQAVAGIESAALQWTAVSDADLSGYNVYVSADGGTTWNPAVNAGNVTQYTVTGLTAGVSYTFAVTAVDTSGNESAKSTTVQATPKSQPQTPPDGQLPPDPSTQAPALPLVGATTFADRNSFLYTGPNPIQTGVAPDTIKQDRTAVLRGKVLDDASQPLPGVKITIQDHPELGQTLSRIDGMFDIAVNGGSRLTVNYQKDGYMSIQRQVEAPWQDYAALPDAVLKAFDSKVTLVNLSNSTEMQVARGNLTTDVDGTRTATLLIPTGAKATMTLADGSNAALDAMHFRATEYTVGDNGPKAMPGELPQFVGYTYAVELSADEAVAAGASTVSFDQTLYYYVDNFLQFPVGETVPVGYYDRKTAAWVPSNNGKIIKILQTDGGIATIDSDGDGAADDDAKLDALGFTMEERTKLAGLYTVGQSLWRVPVRHFTPYDCNWFNKAPDDAIRPDDDNRPNQDNPDINDPCKKSGSIIGCEEQSLGESVPLTGTSLSLNYYSRNEPGYLEKSSLHIPVSGTDVPSSMQGILVKIEIAGKTVYKEFPAEPNQTYLFQWDGRDAYGRTLTGSYRYKVSIGYKYPVTYYPSISGYIDSFGRFPLNLAPMSPRGSVSTSYEASFEGELESPENPYREEGIGGWSLTTHHILDTAQLYMGNGSVVDRADQTVGAEVNYRGDASNPDSIVLKDQVGSISEINNAVDADGSIVFTAHTTDGKSNINVYRSAKDGTLTKWSPAPIGNGLISGFSLDKDGSLYTSQWASYQIVKRTKANPNTAVVVAGNGQYSSDFATVTDGADAKTVGLFNPKDIKFGKDGSVYFIDNQGLFKVGTNGKIAVLHQRTPRTTANFGASSGFATQSNVGIVSALEIGPDGSLYVLDNYMNGCSTYYNCNHSRIRRIDPQGQISLVAGSPKGYVSTSGKQFNLDQTDKAADAVFKTDNIEMDQYGNLHFIETQTNKLFRITPDGKVEELAHDFVEQAVNAAIAESGSTTLRLIAGGTDSEMIFAASSLSKPGDFFNQYRIGKSQLDSDHGIADSGGTQLFKFDEITGLHKQTLDTLTGRTVQSFGYDASGRLTSITDGDGNTVVIERNAQGVPTAIVAPGGQRTELTVENGRLTAVKNPSGEAYTMQYNTKGLLTKFIDPRNQAREYVFDPQGLLISAKDPGGEATLVRSYFDGGNTITYTKYGQITTYKTSQADGVIRHDVTGSTGATTTSYIRDQGMQQEIHYPNGTVVTEQMKGDPRFGVEALLLDSMTVSTPAGRSWTLSEKRSVEEGNGSHPLGLKKMTVTYKTTDNKSGKSTTSTVQYDTVAKQLTETSSLGYKTITTYDDNGHASKIEHPGQNLDPTTYQFDTKGRMAQTQQGSQTIQYFYDDRNNLIKTLDAHGNTKEYSYDGSGRITGFKLNGQEEIQLGRDANGNMTSVTMPNQAVSRQSFDGLDELSGFLPEGDAVGTQMFRANGQLDYTLLPSSRTIDYTYDAGGRMTQMNDADFLRTFTYKDATARLGRAESVNSSVYGVKQAIDYTYDGNDVTKLVWSGKAAGQFDYTYDSYSKPTSMRAAVGGVTTTIPIGWDDDDNLKTFGPFSYLRVGGSGYVSSIQEGTAGSTFKVDKGYDAMGRESSLVYSVKGAEVYRAGQEYNDRGLMVKRTLTTGVTAAVYEYGYDDYGQLMSVKVDGTVREQYGYDANHNRIMRTMNAGAQEISLYGRNDQLQSLNNVQYQYDADGYLMQRGSDTFKYGAKGELVQAQSGGKTIRYTYDSFQRRTAREDGKTTTLYLYGNPIDAQQVTSSVYNGTVTTYYYDEAGLLLSFDRGGARYYVVTDSVGTPQVVYDKNGLVVKSLRYDGFGRMLSDSNPAFELAIGFAGGITDADSKLIRFGYRDYDPETGRWTARDPIMYDGGQANLYAYVDNNPVMLRDPCGMFCVGASAYAGLGAGFKFCVDGDGISACGEAGIGGGGGVDINPFEGISSDESSIEATAKLKSPIGGIQGGFKYRQNLDGNCPDFSPILKADAGPFSVDLLNRGLSENVGPFNLNVTDPGKSGLKFKIDGLSGPSWDLKNIKTSLKLEAAIKGKVCAQHKW